jgi:CRISPR/Cas system CSM-associated protein Csm5 (group 7 of RAMP superfamily)
MYKLIFTSITPIHISNGLQLGAGLDYVLLKRNRNELRKFCKLNFNKVAHSLAGLNKINFNEDINLEKLTKLLKSHLNELFQNHKLDDSFFEYSIDISPQFNNYYENESNIGRKFVIEFINSSGKFYVPASSIKGALLTTLNKDNLGINPREPHLKDKFVMSDSDFIDSTNFQVMITNNRPPKVTMICMKKNVQFTLLIRKDGGLDVSLLRDRLEEYSNTQISNAIKNIQPFKSKFHEPKGADIFEDALINIQNISLDKDEYLINLGFGSGSWFKIKEKLVPKFKSKKRNAKKGEYEAAHTSFTFYDNPIHIGWCKLKIEKSHL